MAESTFFQNGRKRITVEKMELWEHKRNDLRLSGVLEKSPVSLFSIFVAIQNGETDVIA